MARTRSIKPEFWDDEKLAGISRDARLTFIGLWTNSDDYGVVKGHCLWLKNKIFPYDNITTAKFTEWIAELIKIKSIYHFDYHGEKYYFIMNFLKHQKISHPSKARNPEPPNNIPLYSGEIPEDSGLSPSETETETETETYMPDSNEIRLSNLLYACIKENNNKAKKPNMQAWAQNIDYMIRIDERDPSEIEDIITWCQKDSFWMGNILSTAKLRKQFDQLTIKKNGTSKKPKTPDWY